MMVTEFWEAELSRCSSLIFCAGHRFFLSKQYDKWYVLEYSEEEYFRCISTTKISVIVSCILRIQCIRQSFRHREISPTRSLFGRVFGLFLVRLRVTDRSLFLVLRISGESVSSDCRDHIGHRSRLWEIVMIFLFPWEENTQIFLDVKVVSLVFFTLSLWFSYIS